MSILTTAAAMITAVVMVAPSNPDIPVNGTAGLKALATTGSGDMYAAEGYGTSYHKDGGKPGDFTYSNVDSSQQAVARTALNDGEFLAPHFLKTWNGSMVIMVAPHLLKDGEVQHGAGPDDNFIVVDRNGDATRIDFSDKYEDMM